MKGLNWKNVLGCLMLLPLLLGVAVAQTEKKDAKFKVTVTTTEKEKVGDNEKVITRTRTIDDDNAHVTLWKDVTIKADEKYESVVVMVGNVEFYGEADEVVVM